MDIGLPPAPTHLSRRICPILAGAALIRGNKLLYRSASEKLTISAPKAFLEKIYDWCDGERPLNELEALAREKWGDTSFISFIASLMDAGVMVDASMYLWHAASAANYPNWMGIPAAEAEWRQGISKLPETAGPAQISLPEARPNTLRALTEKRCSATLFEKTALPASDLTALLQSAYGLSKTGKNHRTVPSAGGFYALGIHVVLLSELESFSAGVYRVCYALDGSIGLHLQSKNISDFTRAIYHPQLLHNATGLILVSAKLQPVHLKYRNRAYRYALLEAGCVLQNISLACTDLNIGWRVVGGYDDQKMAALTRIEDTETLLAAGIFGKSAPEEDKTVARLPVELSWSDDFPQLSFQMGKARLKNIDSHFCWGRDSDPVRAYDKAVAEAVERHAYTRQARDYINAAYAELDIAIDPRTIVSYSERQYQRKSFPFKKLSETANMRWTPGKDLFSGREVLILADCVYDLGNDAQSLRDGLYTHANSSGCASGVSYDSAIDSAIFELIERDAFMRHWLAQKAGMAIVKTSLPGTIQARISRLENEGCIVSVQLLTEGIYPAYLVFVQNLERHFSVTGASSGYADGALESALSEAETLAFSRLGNVPYEKLRPQQIRKAIEHTDLYANKAYFHKADALLACRESCTYADADDRFLSEKDGILDYLQRRGDHHPIGVDISVDNAPLTFARQTIVTVRAIIPGLIPMSFGYGRMPMGMDRHHLPQAHFPHPFS